MEETNTMEIESIHQNLIRRSIKFKRTAKIFLLLIILSLAVGASIFVYAGYITNNELPGGYLKEDMYYKGSALDQARSTYDHLKISREQSDKMIEKDFQNLNNLFENKYSDFRFYSTLATRIGAIFILFFMAQLFTKIYRYYIRLSVFYLSRADALDIYKKMNNQELEEIVKLFSLDHFDISKTQSPSQNVLEIFKSALEVKK